MAKTMMWDVNCVNGLTNRLTRLIGHDFVEKVIKVHYQEPAFDSKESVDLCMKMLQTLKDVLPNLKILMLEIKYGCKGDDIKYSEKRLIEIQKKLKHIIFVFGFEDEVINRIITVKSDIPGQGKVQTLSLKNPYQLFAVSAHDDSLTDRDFKDATVIAEDDSESLDVIPSSEDSEIWTKKRLRIRSPIDLGSEGISKKTKKIDTERKEILFNAS